MMAELLDKVIADLLGAAARPRRRRSSPLDRAPIRSASHILISVAGALGALRLQACARALNGAAHAEADGDARGRRSRRCIGEIDAAVAFARDRRAARLRGGDAGPPAAGRGHRRRCRCSTARC